MTSYIYVDVGGLETEAKNYLIAIPGSLCDAGRAIQKITGSRPWTPGSTREITRAILRGIGIHEDEAVAAPNDDRKPNREPYWMIATLDDMVCLGCGGPEFLEWEREEFARKELSEAECRRLALEIRTLARA